MADIHANLAAFEAVLSDAERREATSELWCLGDVVGYGPESHECLELLRQYKHICVAGNHDWGAIGKLSISEFNPDAEAACRWTGTMLSTRDRDYLEELPLIAEVGDFTLVHGSPRDPLREYLISTSRAEPNFGCFASRFCLVGHSHVPLVFSQNKSGATSTSRPVPDASIYLGESRLIINPGSVGQPRDGDPRASYAVYDSETKEIENHRVDYAISLTQKKMLAFNLPLGLVARLSYGT
jgi:diadenosine tetraphosphatase ApaH/serine/threonine PP2A family protein phosphatase